MSAEIISALKAMKLYGMASNYPEVAAQARHTDFTPEAFLTQLLKAETAERAVRSMAYQMGAARFPSHRDLAGFEFGQANVDKSLSALNTKIQTGPDFCTTNPQTPTSSQEVSNSKSASA